jgi:hypothetical protein
VRERLPCEFFLIRYVPDPVRGEFVNIGVVLREAGGGASHGAVDTERVAIRFTRDWARVRCVDAEADVEMLEGMEQEIARRMSAGTSALDPKSVIETFEDSLSNSVQMTPARACLAESLPAELEQLMRMYVEPVKVVRTRAKTGRAAIAGAMRTQFERAGVWAAMNKRIAAARYTAVGDPLKIDCGYRVGVPEAHKAATIRMFQAISLESDVEAAKGLAFSASALRDGVSRVESAELELTAVVESLRAVSEEEDEASERYRFGVETMERQAIRVVTVNDLARAAETARRELGL